jgi:hypothetical protein
MTGGMFLGLLSSVPFISIGCCMWVPLGGGIAAVLLTRQRRLSSISYGDGAFAGVISGLFGAVVGTIIQTVFRALSPPQFFETLRQQVEQVMNQVGLEGPMRDFMLRMASGEISAATVAFTFISNVLTYSLFAMIGGILALAILRRRGETTRGTRSA